MHILTTKSFDEDYAALPDNIKRLADKKLHIFLKNPRHPSLRIKKMEGSGDIWEGRITKSCRFTFQAERGICVLRRIGAHDILRTP